MCMHKCMSAVVCNAQACTCGGGGQFYIMYKCSCPHIVQVWATTWTHQLLFVAKQGVCAL